jgi:hypothetical protein
MSRPNKRAERYVGRRSTDRLNPAEALLLIICGAVFGAMIVVLAIPV